MLPRRQDARESSTEVCRTAVLERRRDYLKAQSVTCFRDGDASLVVWQGDEAVPACARKGYEEDATLLGSFRVEISSTNCGFPQL